MSRREEERATRKCRQVGHIASLERSVTAISPAAIGWHRDKAVFGEVIGVSLLAACVFRLRRKVGEKWERTSVAAEPRSIYLLSGPSRTEWEHSIPPVDALRYSVTLGAIREMVLNDDEAKRFVV
jgi:hypothetical protein